MGIPFGTFLKNLKALPVALEKEALDLFDAELSNIAESNRLQILEGETTEGKRIAYSKPRITKLGTSGAYTRAYERKKQKTGGVTEFVDLTLTGTYVNSIKAERDGKKITIAPTDGNTGKAKGLNNNYNKHIGITASEQQKLLGAIAEQLGEKAIHNLIKG